MTEREAINVLLHHKEAFEISGKTAEAIDLVISALEKQEQDRWIPVTERLPEYGVEVLAQLSGSDFVDIVVNWVIDEEVDEEDAEWFEDGVIAWRPLPEPYEAEEQE